MRDDTLKAAITRVWTEHQAVCGTDKVWVQLHCGGIPIARCTVEHLLRGLGLRGVVGAKDGGR